MAAKPLKELSEGEIAEFFASIDTLCFDCDGVLWLVNSPIEGCPEALKKIRSMGKNIYYVTNNSTKTREQYVQKCQKLGYDAAEEEIISTAYLAAQYLKSINFKDKVYLIGPKALCDELDTVGISHTLDGHDPMIKEGFETLAYSWERDPAVKCVLVGFDQYFNYVKLLKASCYLSNPECLFIATNSDPRFPIKPGVVIPGTGSIVTGVQACSGRDPLFMGKPSHVLAKIMLEDMKLDPQRTLMVGDRGNTDILIGTRCGFKTLLVLTGVTSLQEVEEWKKSSDEDILGCVPDYYTDSLADLNSLLDQLTTKEKSCK